MRSSGCLGRQWNRFKLGLFPPIVIINNFLKSDSASQLIFEQSCTALLKYNSHIMTYVHTRTHTHHSRRDKWEIWALRSPSFMQFIYVWPKLQSRDTFVLLPLTLSNNLIFLSLSLPRCPQMPRRDCEVDGWNWVLVLSKFCHRCHLPRSTGHHNRKINYFPAFSTCQYTVSMWVPRGWQTLSQPVRKLGRSQRAYKEWDQSVVTFDNMRRGRATNSDWHSCHYRSLPERERRVGKCSRNSKEMDSSL